MAYEGPREPAEADGGRRVTRVAAARWLGTACVLGGCVLLAFDGRWNPRLGSLPGPGDHGVHALEAAGFVLALTGIALLWKGARGGG